ncbi:TauD/TfdA family dioxygenase [Tessaracoccus flavus]|uniref:TauD/TfdA family dioxygenase n=1 Tax=Tessaracoccus flavus TaxID=1610493 RepID=UPI00089BA474|nr:Taurine dioxygenase, alpha-ketoglutarate-dependent [Tessaracoccus flavus]
MSIFESLPSSGWAVLEPGPAVASDPAAVIELARRYGTVSERDGGGAWPIQSQVPSGTFSVTNDAAPLHTDAQYRNDPEDAFLLACARSAAQGGDSILLAVDDLVATLSRRSDWFSLQGLLQAPIWRWRTPEVFDGPRESEPAAILYPREDGRYSMRWRMDNLVADQSAAWAAEVVHQTAAIDPNLAVLKLRPGQVLVCDNSTVLHGRTAFNDPTRLLWRVRVHR